MINREMYALGAKRSAIRELAEYGWNRSAEIGAENVFDFSIGNPSVPAPECVRECMEDIIKNTDPVTLHGYTSAPGDIGCRNAVADELNNRFGSSFTGENLYLTCGASSSLNIALKALACEGDEFIINAPFFPEYKVFIENQGGKAVIIPPDTDTFSLNLPELEKAVNEHTKAVIINSPNNPTGVVYSKDALKALAELLERKQEEYSHPIYIISDEPYREVVYEKEVPFIPHIYDNTVICYSYSKSLSLPGERIGYVLVPDAATDSKELISAVAGAGRALGYVCAPALFQRVIAKLSGKTADISVYQRNRDILYSALTEMGFDCVRPDGAFYLFMKCPDGDATSFCEKAKKYELLLVPGDGFGCPSYVRISYCVQTEKLLRSLKAFEALAKEYK